MRSTALWMIAASTSAFVLTGSTALDDAQSQPATAQVRPNVIFILADDLGWGDLGCYGHERIRTPNLDKLAAQGTLFTQFYVCGSVCSPSRAAFMTGCFPARLRMHGALGGEDKPGITIQQKNARQGMPDFLDPSVPTITRLMQKGGYAVGHFGKWHLGSGRGAPPPSEYGIDEFRCINANPVGWDMSDPYFRARSSELVVDATISFIEKHRGKPFYVQAWMLLPHATLNPTQEQLQPYAAIGPKDVPHSGATQIYYASVTAVDRAVGRLLARLDELGLTHNTIIVFTSDNGPEDIHIPNASHSGVGSAGPFRGRKRSLYEGGIRVPFIVRWPAAVPAGRMDKQTVVAGCDLLPTLGALAGVVLPSDLRIDGEDMSDALRGREHHRKQPLMWEWRFGIAGEVLNKSPILAMREGAWKLLMNPDRSRVELYDIPHDSGELNNLADRQAEVVATMSTRLLEWKGSLPPGPVDRDAGSNRYRWPK